MLLRLEIRNFALIDELDIELGEGLNILTGETGAGKSIIIDSINMLLGERFSKEFIRTGQEKAFLQAVFCVNNQKFQDIYEKYGIEPESDGTLLISREYSLSGRNVCRVNGRIVTVSMLKEIGERLIDVHGQYDNQSLLKEENHIELLDAFGGEEIQRLRNEFFQLYIKRKEIKKRLQELIGDEKYRERKIDLLKYQINEIKSAKLKTGEDEELHRQRVILSNSEKIADTIEDVYNILYIGDDIVNSVYDRIDEAIYRLGAISVFDPLYEQIKQNLEEIKYQMEDIRENIRYAKENIEYDPVALEQVEERLDLIYKLKKKYGNTIQDIIEYCKNSEIELDMLLKSEEYITELQKQLIDNEKALYDIGVKLNEKRSKAAALLESRICNELEELEMKNTKFKVNIEMISRNDDNETDSKESRLNTKEIKFNENGLDKVQFLISTNPGEPLKPLSKIASGGEMARIMLAIKSILAEVDKIPTLIFDEIDIGISGKASQRVGEKLSFISRNHQVICVTHQAQIACMADNHYLIEKVTRNNITTSKVTKLYGEKIVDEISRILGGDVITQHTRNLAIEMLNNARKFKSN
ncbi:MAG TPA: DNA repair protein RecN [Clostridiaceae bacterium]|nr:DNA repair protein RecN [Clostridiaceae bacterium]